MLAKPIAKKKFDAFHAQDKIAMPPRAPRKRVHTLGDTGRQSGNLVSAVCASKAESADGHRTVTTGNHHFRASF